MKNYVIIGHWKEGKPHGLQFHFTADGRALAGTCEDGEWEGEVEGLEASGQFSVYTYEHGRRQLWRKLLIPNENGKLRAPEPEQKRKSLCS